MELRNAVYEAEMLDKGIPPIDGGLHAQDAWFISVARHFLSYKSEMEYLNE